MIVADDLQVAHFVQRYPPALGGSESFFARLSRHLAAAGDQVKVFTTNALDLEAFWSRRGACTSAGISVEGGVDVRRYPIWRWPGRRFLLKALSLIPVRPWQCLTLPCNPMAPTMWRDGGRLKERFDVVHATAFPYAWPIVCGLRLARRQRIPFLLTPFLHLGNPDDPGDSTRRAYLSPPLLYLLRAADRIFVQTRLEWNAVVAQGIPEDRLVLLGMGVDFKECTGGRRAQVRASWGISDDVVVIGHLANLSEEKGSADLLRAAGLALADGTRLHIVLAGPEMENFRRFRRQLPAGMPFHQLGVLSEEQKRDFFAGLDVFALPSRSDSFGMVLLEAWANGIPNVAYRSGGVAEVVKDRNDGVLVSCGDISRLAETLVELSRDVELRRRLGTAGQVRAQSEFDWAKKLNRVREVYRVATSEKQKGRLH